MLIGVVAAMAALLVAVVRRPFDRRAPAQAEIGVRMAVGAAPGQILRLVVGQGLRLSAAGVLLGIVAAVALTRGMTTMLVGVRPTDPLTFTAMAVLFFVIAIVSSWLPARRAAGLDPTTALREG
jgi:putative ABC transport system permease protein